MAGKRKPQARRVVDESVERRRFKAVLERFKLRTVFERLPKEAREQMYGCRYPDPVLRFDAGWPADERHARLRASLEAAFRTASMEFENPQRNADLSIRDFFAFVPGLHSVVAGTAANSRLHMDTNDMTGKLLPKQHRMPEVDLFCVLAKPVLDAVIELQQEAYLAMHRAVVCPLVERARLDGTMFYADLSAEDLPRYRKQVVMTVKATPPQSRSVTLDGHARPAYRVGTNNEWHRPFWLSVDGGAIDPALAGRELEVYAQSHALRQLHARLNVPTVEPWAEYWLYASLKNPKVVERQRGGDLLIEYRMCDHRLGYLVVTPLEGMLVVRTFLFLTMQPSPVARQLERKLRLTRADAEWLGLDTLGAFTQTDLRDDDTLRPLLESCGCDHLFALADEDWASDALSPTPKPFAQEMKKYLRMAA